MKELKPVVSAIGSGQLWVECIALPMGKDVLVSVVGGNALRIGAVALGVPRPSLKVKDKISASASTFSVVGHKEDELARMISLWLAAELNCVVTVAAGIHVDKANERDIRVLMKNTREAVEVLLEKMAPQRQGREGGNDAAGK